MAGQPKSFEKPLVVIVVLLCLLWVAKKKTAKGSDQADREFAGGAGGSSGGGAGSGGGGGGSVSVDVDYSQPSFPYDEPGGGTGPAPDPSAVSGGDNWHDDTTGAVGPVTNENKISEPAAAGSTYTGAAAGPGGGSQTASGTSTQGNYPAASGSVAGPSPAVVAYPPISPADMAAVAASQGVSDATFSQLVAGPGWDAWW